MLTAAPDPVVTDHREQPVPTSPSQDSTSLEARVTLAAQLAAAIVLTLLFLPVICGQVYIADDLLNFHLPLREFYSQCLAQGDSFDWMPSLFSGYYVTGSGQGGTYHPWHWLLYRCLPVQLAFGLEVVGSYPFMLAGMVLLLKRHYHRRDAAWIGALIFTFSGFNLLHFLHPNAIAVVAHIPWLLLTLDVVLRPTGCSPQQRLLAEVGVALLTASQLLLGYPQYIWYSLLAEIVYCLAYGGVTMAGWKSLLHLGALKAVGLLLGAVQLLPSADALSQSDRQHLPEDYFFQSPLTLPDMLQWLGPYLTSTRVFGNNTHELGVYCGSLTVLLALLLFWLKDHSSSGSKLAKVMTVLGLLAIWLSLGKAGGLYVLQSHLPLVGKFRCPSRIVVLMHLSAAVLAAEGYRRFAISVERGKPTLPKVLQWLPWLCALVALGVGLISGRAGSLPQLLIGPALFFLSWRLLQEFSTGKVSLPLVLFLVADLSVYGMSYAIQGQTMTCERIRSLIEAPPGPAPTGRVIGEIQFSSGPIFYNGNKLLLRGLRQADGYEGLLPRLNLLGKQTNLDSLRICGVQWIINEGDHATIPGLIAHADHPRWLEVPHPLPRIRLSSDWLVEPESSAAWNRLHADGPVIIDQPLHLDQTEYSSPKPLQVEQDRPGRITVSTCASRGQLLVVAERFDPGWRVTVDGQPATLIRANLDYMACSIPAGPHRVEFRFAPESLRQGKLLSLSALLLLAIYGTIRGTWASPKAESTKSLNLLS